MPGCCAGKCCAVFYYPTSPDALRARKNPLPDDHFIADMLIGLTPDEAQARAERFEVPPADWTPGKTFTCKHWDEESGLCGVYEKRPKMCAEYPYGRKCEHGCDYRIDENVAVKIYADRVKRAADA